MMVYVGKEMRYSLLLSQTKRKANMVGHFMCSPPLSLIYKL